MHAHVCVFLCFACVLFAAMLCPSFMFSYRVRVHAYKSKKYRYDQNPRPSTKYGKRCNDVNRFGREEEEEERVVGKIVPRRRRNRQWHRHLWRAVDNPPPP